MANPPARTQPPAGSGRPRLLRTIGFILLAIILLVGLTILIIWLAVKPKRLVYSIESGSIRGYNLSETNHLNSNYNFVLRAYNPNTKVSIYYDKVETSVSYDGQKLAFNTLAPFRQRHKNVTRLGVNLVAQDVALSGDTAKGMKTERSGGAVELDVRMKARIRLKVGAWKGRRTLRVLCPSVLVRFSSSTTFVRKSCDVDTT
ncbi:hypothetical protein RHGRI_002243 [Rhododendron griersonianum]|uniref:Late embryogenesis abundant protein LEA-2 subgroup domain-containing protein n=1 Tax=Rhododendron griersonianum TaxID=479676 RepID=A0AAV6LPI1_9ERIC|nr:hypothetical protein RHGRI_002243 [Rhododendron griersonianum]